MNSITPFQLPELHHRIAQYLGKQDLARCTQVCIDWNTIYNPYLWKSLDIATENTSSYAETTDPPSRIAQAVNGHLTLNLSLEGYPTLSYLLLQCPELQRLSIRDADDLAASTLSLKPNLTSLKLRKVEFLDSTGFWKVASEELPCLRRLMVCELDIDPTATDWFWNTCSRLESLEMMNIDLPGKPDTSLTFSDIKILAADGVTGVSEEGMEILLCRCRKLENLSISGFEPVIPEVMLSSRNVEHYWPKLETISFVTSELQDQDLAQIILGMKSIKCVSLVGSGFGPQSFAAIRPHFNELEVLSISSLDPMDSDPMTGAMMHTMMTSCPKLESLSGVRASIQEILVDQTPWIATNLRFLWLVLDCPADSDPSLHREMFRNLSKLKSLTNLFLGGMVDLNENHSLDFRLSRGMDQLKGLEKLRTLSLEGTIQHMEMEDFLWLLENMEGLYNISGVYNCDPNKAEEVKEMGELLRAKFIKYARIR
ncbi:hypothetical protein BGZ49_003262 [Haplosporangium sp. Z 27]|nr:hypothetical protein BGZ49_003262 [Haplosporangium sp. Z 27]